MCARGMHERLQPCVITGRARLAARQQRRLDLGARRRWLRAHLLQRAVRGGGGALAGCRRGGRGGRAGRGGRERDSLPVRQPARGAHWRSACTAALLPAQRQVGAGLAWGGGQLAALHPLQQWLRAAPPRVAYKGPTAFATQGAAAFAHPRAAQRPCAFEAAAPHATLPGSSPMSPRSQAPHVVDGRRVRAGPCERRGRASVELRPTSRSPGCKWCPASMATAPHQPAWLLRRLVARLHTWEHSLGPRPAG